MSVKIICDRCGKEIENESDTYHIRIYADSDESNRVSTDGALMNILNVFNTPKDYCKNCIKEIEKFIDRKDIKND